MARQRHEVGIAEALTDRRGLGEGRRRSLAISLAEQAQRFRQQEVTRLGTRAGALRQRASGSHEPTRALRGLAALHQSDREPEGATHAALRQAGREERLVGPGPVAVTLEHTPSEVCGDGHALQILGGERSLVVRCDEPVVGLSP